VTGLILLGIGTGSGMTAIMAGLTRHDRPTRTMWPALIGYRLLELLRFSGSATRPRQDLNLLGRSEESLAVATTLAAIVAGTGSAIAYAALRSLGTRAPLSLMPFVCLATGVAGAATPSLRLRRSAGMARRDLVHSLACWLELVALAQAGGMGIESALEAASSVAGEASFLRIRHALARAANAGRSPWDGLERLGGELGVQELEELAASVRLAGTEGARIQSSLSAKSASLRRREMADAHGRANATTERLFLPAIVLMLGFVVFLIYPAGVTLSRLL
jgi:Flp pilus assembly protein TadB